MKHTGKKIIIASLATVSLLVASNSQYKYEFTPLIGGAVPQNSIELENQDIYGASININQDEDCKFEQLEIGLLHTADVKYKNSNLKTDITRFFINAIKEYKVSDNTKLYALAGLGYESLSENYFENDDDGFIDFGVGIKYAINESLSLKADIRDLIKFDGDNNFIYTVGLSIPFGKINKPMPEKQEIVQEEVEEVVIPKKEVEPVVIPKKVVVAKKPVILDDDKDGVINANDKCPNTLQNVKVDDEGCEVLTKPVSLNILFEVDKSIIRDVDLIQFDKYVKYLKRYPNTTIILEGHTDSSGGSKSNLILSNQRASSAKNVLIKMGIEKNRIITKGYGESKPIVANDTKANKQLNRRVTAQIIK